ncbi:amidohydrolase family protein [Rhodococcus ruber]|uniref:Amidohydrolase family protein n=1 Tax=Rhodococcus ruber TaxID=1830 RepID=A0ABT4MMR3_9NOCA|nr:amidohydrolase family protein [Rhodococcus ruber]MCZ4522298.1 amidohydrolase family protein [Rhodococcus ruber]
MINRTTRSLLLDRATIFDGTGHSPLPGEHSIRVDDGVITWVGPSDHAPETHDVMDLRGMFVMPGLVNSHVHLANDASADLAGQVGEDSSVTGGLRAANNAMITLLSGVTTVKDCGAKDNIVIDVSRAIDSKLITGTRVFAAGRVITMTGGHGHFMGVEADGLSAVRAAVRGQLKEGASFIKAMATGGVLTSGVQPTQTALIGAELQVIVEEAHNAGRRVSTHAIGREGIKNAILAGVDTIEHGFHLDEELFELALERGTFLVPTLAAISGIVGRGPSGGTPGWIVDKARVEMERSRSMFRQAVESGINIAAGTDAGTPFNPHDGFVEELIEMVRIGLSPARALLSATRDGAINADAQASIGTIEAGKCADVIAVDGDPLIDITDLRRILVVVKDGEVHRDERSGRSSDDSRVLNDERVRA